MCSVTKWPMQLLCAPPDDDHYDCLMFTGRSKNTNCDSLIHLALSFLSGLGKSIFTPPISIMDGFSGAS